MEGQKLETDSLIFADLVFGKLLCTCDGAQTIFEDHWYKKIRQIWWLRQ